MSYIGSTPTTQSFIAGTDYFNGTGSQTAFTLSRNVVSANDIQATVNNVVQQPNDAYTVSGTTITFTSAPSAGTNNVYVRYLSTTTQSITPSQGTVGWSTLNSDVQQDLGVMGKNRVINGNMVINQRGFSGAITDTYTLDRWAAFENTSGSMTVQQSSVAPVGFTNSLLATITSPATSLGTNISLIRQFIEGYNMADLNWGTANAKTITLSFWVRSSVTGTFGGAVQNGNNDYAFGFSYTINSANTWEYKTVTVVGPTSGTWGSTNDRGIDLDFGLASASGLTANTWQANGVSGNYYYTVSGQTNLFATNGNTWYLTGVQLEVGTQATTFTTAGGSYGAELQLCKRYYQTVNGIQATSASQVVNYSLYAAFAYPVEMRATPTFSLSGQLSFDLIYDNTYTQSSASVDINVPATGNKGCFINYNNFSGLTYNRTYCQSQNTRTTNLSAEL
jgi:hypothetical protein